ncbi:MAG: HAD family hydrolase [Armatimonadota bacterium]
MIFDLFGTLIDYLPAEEYERAFREIAGVLDVPVGNFHTVWREIMPERDLGKFGSIEEDLRQACRLLGYNATPAQIEAATQIRLAIYRRNLAPRDGTLEVLNGLRAYGLRLGLISNCADEIPRLWPGSVFAPLFDVTLFSSQCGIAKPDERIYRMACERLEAQPQNCLYVGDGSDYELTGAQRLGMTAVLICTPDERERVMQREEPRSWTGPMIEHLSGVLLCV